MNNKNERITEYADEEVLEELVPKTEIALQKEFYKIPRRFGSIPVDQLPLGCDPDKQFYKLYPRIALPFQKADKVSFGHPNLEPNRLFWGDNLHVMRMLPSNSIDLIYIDPPFFSGKTYNVLFGDQNEIRSFTDIWEGGMHSYLIWLNARLLEIKRLIKPTGTVYVHLDWHAAHYVKTELDKIFGYDNFLNEIIWHYFAFKRKTAKKFPQKHDLIFSYTKTENYTWNTQYKPHNEKYLKRWKKDSKGRLYRDDVNPTKGGKRIIYLDDLEGDIIESVWDDIPPVNPMAKERIGYPTQKPEKLLERIIKASTNEGDIVADFFCGGGTTPAVAQKMNRRWIACDQSRVAVAITQGRLETLYEKGMGVQHSISPIPDISIEYWGTYEVPALEDLSEDEFRNFVVSAYGGRLSSAGDYIHGYKREIPLFVGSAKQEDRVTKDDVLNFAKEIAETKGKHQGIMLAWSFASSAKNAVEKLKGENKSEIDLIQISLTDIDSPEFKKHITKLHDEYESFLKFILPPEVVVIHNRKKSLTYEFDASESMVLNTGAEIVNVQWDFDFQGRFTPTKGFAYGRDTEAKPLFKVEYKFERLGKTSIACRVQDDLGGEKIYAETISVR